MGVSNNEFIVTFNSLITVSPAKKVSLRGCRISGPVTFASSVKHIELDGGVIVDCQMTLPPGCRVTVPGNQLVQITNSEFRIPYGEMVPFERF